MRYYFAPMEGITTSVYRTIHHRFFPGMDRYYTPFLSPVREHVFSRRDLQEILPEYNQGIPLVPQLLTKHAGDFIWAARELEAMGYREVNLNLGCPSGTVVAKGRGAGMLADLSTLKMFLDEVFSALPNMQISVKTRLGIDDPGAFPALLELYNQYPIAELTVHPRVQKDFYKNSVNLQAFGYAAAHSRNPLCYNGDLTTAEACAKLEKRWHTVSSIMLGRGVVSDPALVTRIKGLGGTDAAQLRDFHDALYLGYCQRYQSRENAVMRMKELWSYMIRPLPDSEKKWKRLKKAGHADQYEAAVRAIFAEVE